MTADVVSTITLAGRRYDWQQLLAWEQTQAEPSLSENDRATLRFAREWLAGAQSFALHTSGSTGTPKPVYLARSQMEASARATGAALGLRAGQQALVCLPTAYVAGRMMLVRGFVLGLDMQVVEPASDPFATLPPDARPDFAAFIPLQAQTLLDTALVAPSDSCYADDTARSFRYRRLLEGMQAILLGGGPIDDALHKMVGQIAAPVYHTYGMTETVTHIALRRLNGPEQSDAFVPLPGVELALRRPRLSCHPGRSNGRGLGADQRHRRSTQQWFVCLAGALGQRNQHGWHQGPDRAGRSRGCRLPGTAS